MSTTLAPLSLLDQLKDDRRKLVDEWDRVIAKRETERQAFQNGNPTELEARDHILFEKQHAETNEKYVARVKELDTRIKAQKQIERRRTSAARASVNLRVTSEPMTYSEATRGEYSYFLDLAVTRDSTIASSIGPRGDVEKAKERLAAHAREVAVEYPKIEADRERRALKAIERSEQKFRSTLPNEIRRRLDTVDFNPFAREQRTTPSRQDGFGGYFVPPLWLNQYIPGLRPGRTTANRCNTMPMPAGTDVIVVPKLANLTTVGVQGADNAAVTETDWSDTAVTGPVKTLAGMSDIAVQLLDQSPYQLDKAIFIDLLADYDKQLDLQVIQGNGSVSNSVTPTVGGQVAGLYSSAGGSNWASSNSVTYTTGAPAPWHLFSLLAAMESKVTWNRFLTGPSFSYVLHPRRAMWLVGGTDTTNRPLVESQSFGPFNVQAVEPDSVPAEGQVMQLPWGPRVYMDANIPTTDTAGGGSAQDIAIGALFDDCWLFEGGMRTDVFPEILSGTLGIRFRVYNYVAFLVRYGQSLAIGSGSGFTAPTGAVSSITF